MVQATEFALIVAAARKEVERALASKDREALEAFAPSFAIKDGHLFMSHAGGVADLGNIIGPPGNDGFRGRDGKSIKGDKGEPGRDGVDGKSIRGEKGDKGDKGERGDDGADGIGVATAYVSDAGYLVIELSDGKKITAGYVRGIDGKNGKATIIYGGAGGSSGGGGGEPGPPGADGASAYEVAVENGFVGTVEQWLASLVGPKGDKGDTGDTGPAGTPNKGTATLAFGAAPGTNVVTVNITGQTGITSAAQPKAWFAADTTADHNSYEHAIMFPARIGLACGDVINGVGFTIYASTELRLTGNVTCRWEWS